MSEPDPLTRQVQALSLPEVVGQLLCPLLTGKSGDDLKRLADSGTLGCAFFNRQSLADWQRSTRILQDHSPLPVLVAADLEYGAKSISDHCTGFPWPMGMAAANDEDLVREMGRATAVEGRHAGIHWALGPSADLCLNFRSPPTNLRCYGDQADRVARLAAAHVEGIQEGGLMAACAKHFPGDGLDERDQHLCTSVNSLSEKEWWELFGRIYKGLMDAGVLSLMAGHISLPFRQGCADRPQEALPATLCPVLLKDLLRNELGFEGILLSDAAPMLGLMSRVREEEAAVRFFQAGGDVFLFADPERDPGRILQAVEKGILPEEDLRRSARRVLELKQTLGLFRDPHGPAPDEPQRSRFQQTADLLGTRSICVARDNGRVGQAPAPGSRILSVTIDVPGHKALPPDVAAFESVFESRGYAMERLHNPGHGDIIARLHEVDTVLLNFHLLPHMVMGQSRLVGAQAMALWRGWAHHHPDVRITSFGTPYLLFDQPHLPNLLLAFGAAEVSQRAAARVWLGDIEPQGSLPVFLPLC